MTDKCPTHTHTYILIYIYTTNCDMTVFWDLLHWIVRQKTMWQRNQYDMCLWPLCSSLWRWPVRPQRRYPVPKLARMVRGGRGLQLEDSPRRGQARPAGRAAVSPSGTFCSENNSRVWCFGCFGWLTCQAGIEHSPQTCCWMWWLTKPPEWLLHFLISSHTQTPHLSPTVSLSLSLAWISATVIC